VLRSRPAGGSEPLSVERIFGILEHLIGRPEGASLAELSRAVGAPKTSLVGLLNGLQRVRYITREENRYWIGASAIGFALRIAPDRDLVPIARPVLSKLVERTGETGLVGVLTSDGDSIIYIDKVESTNPVRYTVPVGDRRDLYCSAVGKCFLGFFSDDRVKRYLEGRILEAFTENTITDHRHLWAEIHRIREHEVAETKEERVLGVNALAAPIFAGPNLMVAAISIGGPSLRMTKHHQEFVQAVKQAADEVSAALGGKPEAPKVEKRQIL
jgi:DNA-binding IclR family transcriptional regulator